MVGGAVVILYYLIKNRAKDTTLIIEKQGATVIVPSASVLNQPASTSVTTSGSTTGTGTGASTTQGSGSNILTTADLSKSASTTTSTTGAGSGTSTGASTGGVTQNTGNTGVTGSGITGVDTPTGGGQVIDYARPMTGTAGGNVVVAFDGFMYSANGKKLTLNDLIKN